MSLDWEQGRKTLRRVATAIATPRAPAIWAPRSRTALFVPTETHRGLPPDQEHRGRSLGVRLKAAPLHHPPMQDES